MFDRSRSRTAGPAQLLFVLPFLALLAGCGGGGGEAPAPAAEGPVRGGTLVVGWTHDADLLNPVVQQTMLASHINTLIYPNPTTEVFEDCRLTTRPYLAESWAFADDGLSLTMTLRTDVNWEDGVPVTADDVVLTLELMADPEVASPRYDQTERIAAVEKLDSRTVRFTFSEVFDRETQLYYASQDLLPAHLFRDADRKSLRRNPLNENPVGVGPYRLERWERNQEIVLTACDGVTITTRPWIERVVFRIIPEYTTRLTELIRGRIDMMDGVQVEDVERLRRENPEIRIVPRGWRFMEYVAWNSRDPLFADPRVRRALTMCIDRDLLIEVLLTGGGERYGRPCTGTVTPELCEACNEAIEPLPHDVPAAQALLAEAGWTDSDDDGVLDRDGRPFRFTLKTGAGNPRRDQACVLIQSQLKEAGIEVSLEQMEGAVLIEQLVNHEFQAALGGWSASLYVSPRPFWHSGDEYVYNFTSYANPEVDRLIEAGEVETDPEKANAIWHEVQALIYEDQPYTFLYWVNNLMGIHRRFEGVEANLLTAVYGLERWWENPNWEQEDG